MCFSFEKWISLKSGIGYFCQKFEGDTSRLHRASMNIQHFIVQLMHTTLKNVELLKQFKTKIKEAAPTGFDLQGNHHQGATDST
jgi:hypothetical protein